MRVLSRRCTRRAHRRRLQDALVADAVGALNALIGARAGRPLDRTTSNPDPDHLGLDSVQRAVVARLRSAVASNFPPPADLGPDGALRELLQSEDIYHVSRNLHLGSYDISKLRVTKGDLQPREIHELVSPATAEYIQEPRRWVLKGEEELAAASDAGELRGQPYWDPKLKHSRQNLSELLQALDAAGLLTWRRKTRCRVGCFFV